MPAAMTSEVAIFFGISVLILFAIGTYDVLFNFEENLCEMTYMFEFPEYIPIKLEASVSLEYPEYGLYLYAEGEKVQQYIKKVQSNQKLSGIPVLYIPGNAGSYKQSRSIGSVLFRMAAKTQNRPYFDVFTLDLNEELTGLYGGFLSRQTDFVHHALRQISSMYHSSRQKIILVAHSVGGIIARGVFLSPKFDTTSINMIFTLSTPHRPIATFDSAIETYYNQTNEYWTRNINTVLKNVVVVSFAGGHRDILVRSERSDLTPLFPNHPRMLTLTTTSVPSVWASTDHLCIVWCKQLVIAISRSFFSMVDPSNSRIIENPERRSEIITSYFFNRNYTKTVFGEVTHGRKPIPVRYSEGYNVSLRAKKRELPFLQFVFLDNLENEDIFIQSNFWSEKWISICKEESCTESLEVVASPLRIPWYSEHGNFIAILPDIAKKVPNIGSFLVLEIPKREELLELEVTRIPSRSEVRTLSFFDGFRDVTRAHLARTNYFRINIGLREIWQVLYIEVRSDEKCIEKRGVLRFHVPGFSQDTYSLMKDSFLRSSMKLQTEKVEETMPMLELFLNPKCEYEVKIGVTWSEIFGQVIRFYVVQLPAFFAAVIVLKTASLYQEKKQDIRDHLILNGIVIACILLERYFPDNLQPVVGFAGTSFFPSLIIWVFFYGFSVFAGALVEFVIHLLVKFYSYPVYFLLRSMVQRLQSIREKLPSGCQRVLLFPVFCAMATGISYITCGENGMLFALAIYLLKMCYLKRNIVTIGSTEDIKEHAQLFLLALLATSINSIPALVWTKQLPSGLLNMWWTNLSHLDPDPSFVVSVMVSLALDMSSQGGLVPKISVSRSNLFDHIGTGLAYVVATGLLLHAQNAFYLINDFLTILFTFLSLDFSRRAFLTVN